MKKQKYNNNNQKSIRKSNKGKIALATIGLTTVALGATYGVFHQQINAGVSSVFDRLRNPSTKVEQQDKIDNQSILINDLKNDLAVKNEEIRNAVAQIESLTATKSTLESDLQSKSNLLAEKETALASLQSEYDTKTAEYATKKAELESQIDNLNNTNSELNENLESLQSEYDSATLEYNTKKAELEAELESLGGQNTELETALQNLETNYNNSRDTYEKSIANYQKRISQLKEEKETLTASYNTLQADYNAKEIDFKNEKASLIAQIDKLQESIEYYENYIESLATSEQVVVIFEFDGSVYNIQTVDKGTKVSVTDPKSTAHKIFNYWTVDGEQIDLDTYTLDTNTKIIADVTYKYDVEFIVNDINYDSQTVIKDSFATLPSNPTIDGCEFDGWTINGVDIVSNIDTTIVTQNITYTAKFTQLHTVTFVVDGETVNTQTIRNGELATLPSDPAKDGYEFDGWTINDTIIDIENKNIYHDTVFTAKFTKLVTVSFYSNIGSSTQIASFNVRLNDYASGLIENPSKELYEFAGWTTSKWGTEAVDLNTYPIVKNTSFFPLYNKVQSYVKIYDGDTLLYNEIHNIGDTVVIRGISPLGRENCYFTGYYTSMKNRKFSYDDVTTILSTSLTLNITQANMNVYAFYSEYCIGQFVSTTNESNSFTIGYSSDLLGGGAYSSDGELGVKNEISEGSFGSCINLSNFDINNATFIYEKEGEFTINGVSETGYMEYKGEYDEATDSWTFTETRVLDNGDREIFSTETFVRSAYAYGLSSKSR